MRHVLQRHLIVLAASAVTLTAFAMGGPLPALADPLPAPNAAPTTTVTAVGIPTASVKSKQLNRRQAQTDQGSGSSAGENLLAELPEQATQQFSTVGVTWTPTKGSADATVQARTKAVGGTWSDWIELENDSAESPPGATRVGTSPIYVGESDGVEIKVSSEQTATTLPDLQVSLIDSPEVAADADPARAAAPAAAAAPALPYLYPKPSIVSRAGWGANESWRKINPGCATPDIDDTIKGAVVHHTAGSNSYTASQSASIIRGVYAYHTKTQGWCDIGYNFLVDKFGKIYEGRAGGVNLPVHGAHATSWNTDTVGVSIMGNFETATPSAAVMESVAKLLAWKLEGYYRNPKAKVTLAGKSVYTIFGHGDVMSTACPGRNVRSRLPALRDSVASKIGSFDTPIYRKWKALGGEAGLMGSPHIGEAVVGDGRYTRFTRRSMYYKPSLGTFFVAGIIRDRYDSLKGATGPLGFPTTDELKGLTTGSRVSRFQRGWIYWGSSTGAWSVSGEVKKTYDTLGQDRSALGLPVAAQANLPIGGAVQQRFKGGYVVWSSATKGQPMLGAIGSTWMGFSAGGKTAVGLPTAAQAAGRVGGLVVQRTKNGALYASGGQVRALHSQIYQKYASLGAETSRLGLPTSNNYVSGANQRANFQHGQITYNPSTGQTTVTYS